MNFQDITGSRNCVCCGEPFAIHSANHVRCDRCKRAGRKIATWEELAYTRLVKQINKISNITGQRRGQRRYTVQNVADMLETIRVGPEK